MQNDKQILNFIENTSYLYPEYIFSQLKKEKSLNFIRDIIKNSDKELSEAVLILISAIKYSYREMNAFSKLEAADFFQEYIDENYDTLLKLCIGKSVQGNIPERALPLFEVFAKNYNNSPLNLIELGASYGMIGRSLLNPDKLFPNKNRYFKKNQQFPDKLWGIKNYLGIEHDPPDRDWILASVWQDDLENRLLNFIEDFKEQENFELIRVNAFGFSKNESVRNFSSLPGKILVLTSFMLYQFDEKNKKSLIDEILKFCERVNGHWVNQAVKVSLNSQKNKYFIALNGKTIIELNDDTCLYWRWLND